MPAKREVISIDTMADKIRARRIELGMTQDQLAKEIGAKQCVVANWERGLAVPRTQMLPKVAKTLGCRHIDDLYPEEVRP